MLKHNFTILYRGILKARSYFLINQIGLATGLACTLLIYLWVRDEVKMDKFHDKDARLFQVMEHQQYADHIMTTTSTPGVLADALKEEFPEMEYAATTTWVNPYTLSKGDITSGAIMQEGHNIKANGFHVGKDFFNIFSYNLIVGDAGKVLEDKYAMVVSRDLALKLFGTDQDIVGKTVDFQRKKTFTITGIFEYNAASSMQFDFVMNFEEFRSENEWVNSWGNNGPSTYVILKEGSDAAALEDKIRDFVKSKNEQSNVTLFLKPFSERYLYGRYENGKPAGGRIEYVKLFSIIAIFILLIACINFMNLSTARASRKAKEIGIKKTVGAHRRTLVFQFLSESMITAIFALFLALTIVWLFLPQFNIITDKKILLHWSDSQFLLTFLGITLITGLLSGSYPAIFLSGFNPVAVLKGEMKGSWAELWARKGLVVFQFALSVVLIVSVLVIYKQIEYIQSKSLGYNKENLIRFPMVGNIETSPQTFLQEVRRIPGVINASGMGHTLMGRNNNTSGLQWEGKNPDENILFENIRVDYDMLETLGVEFVEGRSFSRDFPADTTKIIFNESAIRVMNLEDPIGKVIKLWRQYDLEIIGVVKDFHFQSLHDAVNPLFFFLSPRNTWNVMVRIEGGREKETLAAIERFYREFNPGFTFDFMFQDEEYAKLYASEQRVASLSGYFAGFAILISCLGLFGLATFSAERRLKEIGIRKVLGSSVFNVVLLLSKEFTRLVLISLAIGLPVSYWLMGKWMERFAFHIELEWWFFVMAGAMSLVIAWITVASQAFKAARINPVLCLRIE